MQQQTLLGTVFTTRAIHTDPLDCFACILNGAEHHFGIEIVREFTDELRLNRQLLVHQRQIELQLTVIGYQNSFPLCVILRPTGSTQHLHICRRRNYQTIQSDHIY